MDDVMVIAQNTASRVLRMKALYFLLAIVICIIASGQLYGDITVGREKEYSLDLGFAMIMIIFLVWIPLNEMAGQTGDILNNISTGNVTYDSEMIERNNIAVAIFGGLMIFLFLAFAIWVFKASSGNTGGVLQ